MKRVYGEKNIDSHSHIHTERANLEKLFNCCIIYHVYLVENKEHNNSKRI